MKYIIYPVIRILLFLLGLSITIAIVIATTRYLVGMFTVLPVLIPLAVFVVLLIIIFFYDGFRV